MDYFPYGKILRQFIKTPEKYVTTGHERDVETGLDYRGARFYDSDVARFLSLDPLAAEYPLLSDYCYVAANPLLFVDKDGRQVEPAFKNETDKKKYETVMSQVSQSTEFNIMFNQIDIKEEVYKIRMMTSSEKAKYDPRGRAAYNPKSNELIFRANSDIHEAAIIEEIAHAGQRDFYKEDSHSKLANEVEAKAIKMFIFYKDLQTEPNESFNMDAYDMTNRGYNLEEGAFIGYFSWNTAVTDYFDAIMSGKEITEEMETAFQKELNTLTTKTAERYEYKKEDISLDNLKYFNEITGKSSTD